MGRPRNADRKATRGRVFAAMRAVTLKRGIMAATLEAVAKEADVAKSTAGPAPLLFEHLIDYVFAALVAEHSHMCRQAGASRWQAFSMSTVLLESEPDLAALLLISCTLAAPTAPSDQAAVLARHFRQRHLAARRALADDAMATNQGTISRMAAQAYAADVVADYIEIAAKTWARQPRLVEEEARTC